jgi:hypothetical protein
LRQRGLLQLNVFTHRVSVPKPINPAPALTVPAVAMGQLLFLG